MTIRLDMLREAGRAKSLLDDRTESVVRFARGGFGPDGGFRGRGGESDLYYTLFAVEILLALDAELPSEAVASYLRSFGAGDSLDLVHLACLARCWADLPGREPSAAVRQAILERLDRCRLADGGFGHRPGETRGSVYYGLLALNAYQDFGAELPDSRALALASRPGGDEPTPLLAGALLLLAELGEVSPDAVPLDDAKNRLLARHDGRGGFAALPGLPVADLLSTATALHALARTGVSVETCRASCLRFVNSLWSGDDGRRGVSAEGGFRGVAGDGVIDSEYTFYGLLSLGHLGGKKGSP
jgi:hypothetical protein